MIELAAKLQVFFHQYLYLLMAMLLLLVVCALVLPRVLYRKHVASNGKIELIRRFNYPAPTLGADRQLQRYKPLSVNKRRKLALLFTAQMIVLGLIVYGVGIALLDIALTSMAASLNRIPEPFTLLHLLIGIVCAIAGVLIIYWRKKANPFSDQ